MSDSHDTRPQHPQHGAITRLLGQNESFDGDRIAELYRLVEHELRVIAQAKMSRERPGHTLQPTVLVDEAFVKLVDQHRGTFDNRRHFFGAAAEAMRRILVDHARARLTAKRGGGRQGAQAEILEPSSNAPSDADVLGVHEEIDALAREFPRAAEVVKLRFFGGLTNERIAELLGVTTRTVTNDWQLGRAWLHDRLRREG